MNIFLSLQKDFRTTFPILLQKGFFHIIGASTINKFVLFGSSILLVNILSKTDYGIWAYSSNILNFFMLFGGLGIDNGIIYYGALTDNISKKQAYLKFGLNFGMMFNILIAIIILFSTYTYDFPINNSDLVLRGLSLLPLFITLFSILIGYFRANFKNKEFSLLSTINSISLCFFLFIGSQLCSLKGVVLGHYAAYTLTILLAVFLCRKLWNFYESKYILPRSFKSKFLSYSFTCSLTNAVSSVLYLLDIFLIGLILKDTNILASYKTATLIPFGLNFIPASIMTFSGPYFTKMSHSSEYVRYYYIRLKRSLFIFNLFLCLGLYSLAPYIITTLFGSDYTDSITIFKVLILGYFIAGTFRIPNGNLIASIGKVKINLTVAIISSLFNIILDIALITKYGSLGAALATIFIFIISSFITEIYIMKCINLKFRDYIKS